MIGNFSVERIAKDCAHLPVMFCIFTVVLHLVLVYTWLWSLFDVRGWLLILLSFRGLHDVSVSLSQRECRLICDRRLRYVYSKEDVD
jgi:hypothetical protein